MTDKPSYTAPAVRFDKEDGHRVRGRDLTGCADGYFVAARIDLSDVAERRRFISADGKPINLSD